MKIAIPLNGDRISPRFNYTGSFFIVEFENKTVVEKRMIKIDESLSLKRVRMMCDLEIDILICCGIDRCSAEQLDFHGIRLYQGVIGYVEEILVQFLENHDDFQKKYGGIVSYGLNPCCRRNKKMAKGKRYFSGSILSRSFRSNGQFNNNGGIDKIKV